MAILLAVMASFANAMSAILQRLGVQNAPAEATMSLSLIAYGLKRWTWLVGVVFIGLGFLLQAVALRFGQLSLVQPIVPVELLFLVLLLGTWFRYPITLHEWLSSLATAVGLAGFLIIANPHGGARIPGLKSWLVVFVVVGAVVTVATGLGFTGPRWFRASMFGTAAGMMFALSAALTKVFTSMVTKGWGHVFIHWEPYALVGAGLLGLFLTQSAYHAGPITAAQAPITTVDPLASVCIGIWLFGDQLQTAGWRLPGEVVSMAVLAGGLFVLSRSPLVAGAKDDRGGIGRLSRQPRRVRFTRSAEPGAPD